MEQRPNQSQPSGTNRRRFRYSLRTMLLVITALGLWLGWKFSAAREQRKAVAELSAVGVYVAYEFNDVDSDHAPAEPAWLIDILGVDFFHDVILVTTGIDKSTEKREARAALPILAHLPELQKISNLEIAWGDDDLQCLAPLGKLEVLTEYIPCTATGVGFKNWRSRDTVKAIFLHNSPVTDAGMQEIKQFKNLTMLWLINSEVTDASIEAIASMPKLTDVFLEGSQVTPEGVRRLKTLRPSLACDLFPLPEGSQ